MEKLIRLKDVLAICGLSRSSIYWMAKRGQFPQPVKIGERAVAWVESEVREWIEQQLARREDIR